MAETVVNFLMENLLELVSENVKLIAGVGDDFDHLIEEVQRLKAFLDDAAKWHSNSSQWTQFVNEIRKIVYKSEDVIDKFLVEAKIHQEKNKLFRWADYNHLGNVRDLATRIKDIHGKVQKIRQDNLSAFQPSPELTLPKKGAQEAQELWLADDEVVGFNDEAKIVIKRLLEGPEYLDVVPVVGMAGLGKTTLARKIFKDSQVSREFFKSIWVSVGESYESNKLKDVLLNILKTYTKRTKEYQIMDVNQIATVIRDFMSKGGKCLIVLDDVWAEDVVDSVKKVFPEDNKGHRIMMTTREINVASHRNTIPHNLKFLLHTESFQLLKMRVFDGESCPDELAATGESIAGKCSGVPLAVVVIAGTLRGRINKNDWLIVEKNVEQHLIDRNDPKSCLKFVEMSYVRLPQEIKPCFLYCAAFPRAFEIPAWKLIRLWIAEGFIKSNSHCTVEELAEYYLRDLVNRNLVMVMEKRSDGQIKTCRVHDMLHLFCREVAKSETLLQEECLTPDPDVASTQGLGASRRLCIQPSAMYDFISRKPCAEHIRSFLCFSSEQKQMDLTAPEIQLIHKAFPLIRVLDIEPLKFHFTRELKQLFHLRYIAITGDFRGLPPYFLNFWNLQTLVLNTSTSEPTLDIKADIWNMLRLRHLHTNIPAKLPPPPNPIGKDSCLQTLSMVAPESCKKDVLEKACNLKKLSIRGQMATFLDSSKGGISNLEELKCLEHLKLLHDPRYLHKEIHLPLAFFRFLRKLKKLTLSCTRFDWSEADRLGQLECLEVLKLKENAFTGQSWKAEMGGFKKLQVLWIERADFKSWEASNVSFPILRHLVLVYCDNLETLPQELADVPSLQEIRLENTNKLAIESGKLIEVKKEKMQAHKSIKFKLTIPY